MSNTNLPVINIQAKPPTNWSRKEGIQLCHLSINISVDSVHGTDQPIEKIWEPIRKNFQEERKEEESCLLIGVALGRNPSFGVEFLQYFKQIENRNESYSNSEKNESKPKPVAASTPVRRHVVGNSGEEEEGGEEEARTIGRKRTKKVVQEKSKAAKLFEMFQERNKLEDGQVHDYMEML
ncbi:hypothetical protein G6F56_005048 [Rhizopus delemar]|nr:hypothetical protein G6F56_005048 [Rhizopus delemar]